MVFDLRPIFREKDSKLSIDCSLDFSKEEFNGTYPMQKPVKVLGLVKNKAGIVSINAQISVFYLAPCDRCAENAEREYTIKLDRVIVDRLQNEPDDEKLLLEDMQLNLYEVCFEETVLNLPLIHLCNESCKGICPACGKNLNLEECTCNKD